MTQKRKINSKERDNMDAVLTLDEYRAMSTPQKNNRNFIKHTKKEENRILTDKDYAVIYELETRCSSADEFPLLWDEEGD